MPTGLLNVVCDECFGGWFIILPTGERQLQHQDNCPYKYREDTFLIELHLALSAKNPKAYKGTKAIYPKEAKLNPIIYDLLCAGKLTYERSNKINHNFQLVKEAMKKDGIWCF